MLYKKFQEAFRESEDAEAGTSDGVRKAWMTRKGGQIVGKPDDVQKVKDWIGRAVTAPAGSEIDVTNDGEHKAAEDLVKAGMATVTAKKNYGRISKIKMNQSSKRESEDAEAGTSDGVRKAWITRKGGASTPADNKADGDSMMRSLGRIEQITGKPVGDTHPGLDDEVFAALDSKDKGRITSTANRVAKIADELSGKKKAKEATNVPAKDQGWGKCFYTTWMMPFRNDLEVVGSQEATPKAEPVDAAVEQAADLSGFDQVQALLNENPEISGATLLNLLKAKGFTVSAPATVAKEADSASANLPSMRPQENKKPVSLKSVCNFRESSYRDNGIGATRYRVKLINEGLGNFANAFYYPKEALANAVAMFEGKKCFANHPSLTDEQNRPERDVREIIGHFENVALEEDSDGRAFLAADCCLMPDQQYEWARGLFRQTVEYSKKYPDKDLVGLSINANGDAEEVALDDFLKEARVPKSAQQKLVQAKEQGIDRIRVVSRITDAMSCDLVTEAGAGGKIVKLIEGEKVQ